MGISTYVRVNNFQFSRPDEVHFEQLMISLPNFAALLSFRRRFAFARQPNSDPTRRGRLPTPTPTGPIDIDETMSASRLLRHSLQHPSVAILAVRPEHSFRLRG